MVDDAERAEALRRALRAVWDDHAKLMFDSVANGPMQNAVITAIACSEMIVKDVWEKKP